MRVLELLCWLGPAAAALAYAGYPLLLAALAVARRRPVPPQLPDDGLPAVSIIIAAHNEERHIAARLDNLLQTDYPAARREIIVVDDGSTDATAAVVRGYADRGVRLLRQHPQQGKTAAQNLAAAAATGEVLVFADANGAFLLDALRLLVRWFADPAVGGVCGALQYVPADGRAAGFGERLYWHYECLLKRLESMSGSLVGMNGALYALPRRWYEPLPPHAQSDFVIALRLRARGKRVVYDAAAVCREPVYARTATHFAVKRRIVARAMATLLAEANRLRHIGQPWFAAKLIAHKVVRWLLPWLLLVSVLSAAALGSGTGIAAAGGRTLLALYLLFLAMALVGAVAEGCHVKPRLLSLPYYFCVVNAAAMLGLLDMLRGRVPPTWRPQRG